MAQLSLSDLKRLQTISALYGGIQKSPDTSRGSQYDRNTTGQQKQDDMRMLNKYGMQNVRNSDGSLAAIRSEYEVNREKALKLADGGANAALLSPRDRELQRGGLGLRQMERDLQREESRERQLEDMAYSEAVNRYNANNEMRQWQKDMWGKTRDKMGGTGGNYRVTGLR